MTWSSHHFIPFIHATGRGCAEFLVAAAVFATADPTPRSLLCGGLVSLTGECFRIWSAGHSSDQTPQGGPYRWLRHPSLFGSALLFIGLAMAGRQVWIMAAALLLLTTVYLPAYRHAEQQLAKVLQPSFAVYKAAVPAFLPRLWPAPTAGCSKFSWQHALLRGRRREAGALLALLLGYGTLYGYYLAPFKESLSIGAAAAATLFAVGRMIYYRLGRSARLVA